MVSKFIDSGTSKEHVWEPGAILDGNKGTRPPLPGRLSLLWNCHFKAEARLAGVTLIMFLWQ